MLMFREKIPACWLEHILKNLDQVLVDHAHLERKAATSAITLGKYRQLWHKAGELNAIAIEELQHFQMVLDILHERSVVFQSTSPSPWINGLMKATRKGVQGQVIDHLLVASLIEGRSCEKFQLLSMGLADKEPELSRFYASLVESEGNHYASYVLMAREIDEDETRQRLDYFLDMDASLISVPNPLPVLH